MKEYWFGFLISLILLIGFMFFLLVILSPRYDYQKRGFIPCTEAMAENIMACPKESKFTCGIKHILENTICDAKVIGKGFSLWMDGKQSTPWANYIFTPEIPEEKFFEDEVDNADDDANIEKIQKLEELSKVKADTTKEQPKKESENEQKK